MGFVDLTGLRFGRLVVHHRVKKENVHGAVWECVCDCGGIVDVTSRSLVAGHTRSCGCLRTELLRERGRMAPGRVPTAFYELDGEKLSIRELSERTGIPENTIRSWHQQGKDVIGNIRKRIGE